MIVVVVLVLVLIIIALFVYDMNLDKKLKASVLMGKKIGDMSELFNEFLQISGKEETVEEKLKEINDLVIEKCDIKYSTIVVFDGAQYIIKASNVDKIHYETLSNLHTEEIFKDSVTTATPKYITVDSEGEKLPYQKVELGRAKSAMFFPLYVDNVYIGYWIMESGKMHAFDDVDITLIETIRNNIIAVLSSVSYQSTLENIVRVDKFTGLNSAEYLYGEGKRIINKFPTSAVCMFRITNIEDINEKTNRQMGNEIITEVSNIVKNKITSQYIFVRYMGPLFVIVLSGVAEDSVEEFLEDLKKELEELEIVEEAEEIQKIRIINGKKVKVKEKKEAKIAIPKINFVVSTYYKGTGIEQLTKKLEEYLNSADKDENQINYI